MASSPASLPLPAGIRSRMIAGLNGLDMHVLEAGHEIPGRPALLLLHGFPELAFSWRRVMVPLAEAGFHVIAPDQRGYGHTAGVDTGFDADLAPFRFPNLVRDALGVAAALGHTKLAAIVGHDFGASVAGWAAIIRPDVCQRVAIMSAPFQAPPALPFATADRPAQPIPPAPPMAIHEALGRLNPPRQHYHWYYSQREANANMQHARQGLHAFLRAYYHHKSADWKANRPHTLTAWTAEELAKLPTYYVMPRDTGMAETVAVEMPTAPEIAANRWLPDADLEVYTREYARTGFQGGLNWYRVRTVGRYNPELELWSGRTIDIPATFISGASDWGIHQTPGALEAMSTKLCTRWHHSDLIDGAGHWVQQEQPEAVVAHLLAFIRAT
jgi:pimeloyl-ACP methyl ester carboxylesterase